MNRIKGAETLSKGVDTLSKWRDELLRDRSGHVWTFDTENENFGCGMEYPAFDFKKAIDVLRSYRESPELAELRLRVADLEERVKQHDELMREFLSPGEPMASDPIEEWFLKHPEDREKYKGQQIAFQKEVGIVASARTGNELVAKVKELGLLERVEFGVVAVASV